MFERFKKKQPEKKNPMDQFKTETHEHGQFGVLFGSNPNIKDRYKSALGDVPCVVVKDKEENRISDILHCAGKSGNDVIQLQTSALTVVAIAASQEQALLMSMGMLKYEPQGVTICPGCLQQAIFKCEEQLNALKDLQEATKEYCK